MRDIETQVPRPWQPITASGVAAFANGSSFRLAAVAGVIALGAFMINLWVTSQIYVPALEASIGNFPDEGHLANGLLDWRGEPGAILHRSTFVEVLVNTSSEEMSSQTADVLFEITPRQLNISSLFGILEVHYQTDWIIAANRPGLQSWWEAWRLPALSTLSVSFLAILGLTWLTLATLYCLPAFILAVLGDRKVTLSGCWKLALAALLPGAIFLSAGLVLYSIHQLNLTGLLIVFALHLVVGWTYLFLGVRQLPLRYNIATGLKENPFQSANNTADNDDEIENPFDE